MSALRLVAQVEYGEFSGYDNLYVRYALSFGHDWTVLHGLETGLSQMARRSGSGGEAVWNFPIDVALKSTCAFGWPRLALSVYAVDALGRDAVVGYASVLVPPTPGPHAQWVYTYAPKASSILQRVRGWIAGAYPEFFDPKLVARSEGREVTRVQRRGRVRVSLTVMTR
ncbi:B9 domain-containing protein [Tribonema minus]|uniref:B9 domain-containing protein 1 n=1 Tax=Tribonema minus TaxID=303371 RepID=A0A836CI87_9STRA|nr:B9 domain-containing protein [Tribonema minus]